MRIRKQVYELTLADISEFPIWEFALDEEGLEGQDEATVRPCEVAGALDCSQGMFVVCAQFTLTDGSKMWGMLTPPFQGDNGLGILQPVIITPCGQVMFWYGMATPDGEALTESYERLGRDAKSVFPIHVTSQVELVGGPVHCVVPGFIVLDDSQTGGTRTIT